MVAPECAVLAILPHRHHVEAGLTQYALSAQYGLRDGLQLSLRMPFDRKAMTVRYATLEGSVYAPPYGDIHHRTETLSGLSDPMLLVEWSPHPSWILSGGSTFPAGKTEPDPVMLGMQGIRHQHIQFGSGTYQPKLALQWARPGAVSFVARGEATLSLYESGEGFRAPSVFAMNAGPSFRLGRMGIDPRIEGQVQTLGRWNGVVDEGTGFRNGGVRFGISLPARDLVVTTAIYRELWSRGLDQESFRQGTTWSLGLTWTVD
ncbi:MAG TPA: hypothetical protein VNL91_03760 [Thermoanaerobaculia bacterium]|nr:hypothetical protein [Thermoanaerobaculia bacterium]